MKLSCFNGGVFSTSVIAQPRKESYLHGASPSHAFIVILESEAVMKKAISRCWKKEVSVYCFYKYVLLLLLGGCANCGLQVWTPQNSTRIQLKKMRIINNCSLVTSLHYVFQFLLISFILCS